MTVRTMELSQVLSLKEHLEKAAALQPRDISDIRALAAQLDGKRVLPILGAGASYDCGMRLTRDIAQDLRADYLGDSSFAPHAVGLGPDLGAVTDAIYDRRDQKYVVRAVGLHDPTLWPGGGEVSEHACAYRALARLARESIMEEAITLNYDCGHEAALWAEGFSHSNRTEHGKEWRDHATIVPDAAAHQQVSRGGVFTLFKAHGCAEHYRKRAVDDEDVAASTIIIRKRQLNSWRNDLWIRDVFRDRARTHVLLLIGFSGNDPVICGELEYVLRDVYESLPSDGVPRIVVIDYETETSDLRGLVNLGLGEVAPAPDAVTKIKTSGATTTSATLVLLAETLALKLSRSGVSVPKPMDPRLATLIVSGPTMLRWSYLLRRPAQNQYVQRINLQEAAARGYVPLSHDPQSVARMLQTRDRLRSELGRTEPETIPEALDSGGFLINRGCAFLPVGLDHQELLSACQSGGPIDHARGVLEHPKHLDCILVSDGKAGRGGVHIETGEEVGVP